MELLPQIEAAGGQLVGLTSEHPSVDYARARRYDTLDNVVSWKGVVPPMRMVHDPVNRITAQLGVVLSPIAAVPGHAAHYAKGGLVAQPGCCVISAAGETWFRWVKRPAASGLRGDLKMAVGRCLAEDVWRATKAKLDGEVLAADLGELEADANRRGHSHYGELCRQLCWCCPCLCCCK